MTCQPVSSDAQPARIRLTSAQDWLGSVGETFAARLSLAPTPDNVQNRGESMHLEATRVAGQLACLTCMVTADPTASSPCLEGQAHRSRGYWLKA